MNQVEQRGQGAKPSRRVRGAACTVAGLVLLVGAFIGAGSPASADSALLNYGWWYLPNQVPNNVAGPPQPPWVPSDGMYVAGEPEGPLAVAAVEYTADGPARLTLDLTENGQAGLPSVAACVALTSWDGQSGGRWEGRPAYDCANEVVGEVSDDGQQMTFELTPKLQRTPGRYDLALVPTGLVGFSTTFDRPTSSSLVTGPPASLPGDGDGPNASAMGKSSGGGFAAPADGDFGAFSGGPSSSAADLGPTATAPAPVPAPPVRLAQPSNPVEELLVGDDRNQRIAAVAGLGLMVLGAWWLAGRSVRPPRLLGSLAARGDVVMAPAAEQTRGIGRFARPRG